MEITYRTELSEIIKATAVTTAIENVKRNIITIRLHDREATITSEMSSGALSTYYLLNGSPIYNTKAKEVLKKYYDFETKLEEVSLQACRATTVKFREELTELKKAVEDRIVEVCSQIRYYTSQYRNELDAAGDDSSKKSSIETKYKGASGLITVRNNEWRELEAKLEAIKNVIAKELADLEAAYVNTGDNKTTKEDTKETNYNVGDKVVINGKEYTYYGYFVGKDGRKIPFLRDADGKAYYIDPKDGTVKEMNSVRGAHSKTKFVVDGEEFYEEDMKKEAVDVSKLSNNTSTEPSKYKNGEKVVINGEQYTAHSYVQTSDGKYVAIYTRGNKLYIVGADGKAQLISPDSQTNTYTINGEKFKYSDFKKETPPGKTENEQYVTGATTTVTTDGTSKPYGSYHIVDKNGNDVQLYRETLIGNNGTSYKYYYMKDGQLVEAPVKLASDVGGIKKYKITIDGVDYETTKIEKGAETVITPPTSTTETKTPAPAGETTSYSTGDKVTIKGDEYVIDGSVAGKDGKQIAILKRGNQEYYIDPDDGSLKTIKINKKGDNITTYGPETREIEGIKYKNNQIYRNKDVEIPNSSVDSKSNDTTTDTATYRQAGNGSHGHEVDRTTPANNKPTTVVDGHELYKDKDGKVFYTDSNGDKKYVTWSKSTGGAYGQEYGEVYDVDKQPDTKSSSFNGYKIDGKTYKEIDTANIQEYVESNSANQITSTSKGDTIVYKDDDYTMVGTGTKKYNEGSTADVIEANGYKFNKYNVYKKSGGGYYYYDPDTGEMKDARHAGTTAGEMEFVLKD